MRDEYKMILQRIEKSSNVAIESNDKIDTKTSWILAWVAGVFGLYLSNPSLPKSADLISCPETIVLCLVTISTVSGIFLCLRALWPVQISVPGSFEWEKLKTQFFDADEFGAFRIFLGDALRSDKTNDKANATKSRRFKWLLRWIGLHAVIVGVSAIITAIY